MQLVTFIKKYVTVTNTRCQSDVQHCSCFEDCTRACRFSENVEKKIVTVKKYKIWKNKNV